MNVPKSMCLAISLYAGLLMPAPGYAGRPDPDIGMTQGSSDRVVSLATSLTPLRSEFNAAANAVRLVYIVNADCRACPHPSAAAADPATPASTGHMQVFVIYIAAPDVRAPHSAPQARHEAGTHVYRYRDKTGAFAQRYRDALGFKVTTATVSMIYGRGEQWTGRLPPKPDFWIHQLHNAPAANHSNGVEFSKRAALYLARLRNAPLQTGYGGRSGARLTH